MLSKLIQFVKAHQADIILVIGVILISLLSFAVGYITAKYQAKEPLRIEESHTNIRTSPSARTLNASHLRTCLAQLLQNLDSLVYKYIIMN